MILAAVLIAAGAALLIGNARSMNDSREEPARPAAAPSGEPRHLVYAVMGDSLGRGVRPGSVEGRGGYAPHLRGLLREDFGTVDFIEAACGGATTTSFIEGGGRCAPDLPIPYANTDRATAQLAWGVSKLGARTGLPTLVTLTIGGNDLAGCIQEEVSALEKCLKTAFPGMRRNWEATAKALSDAAGPRTVLSVMTLYDPALGALKIEGGRWAKPARAFHKFLVREVNPAIREIFGSHDWQIADMGEAMFEDGPISSGSAPVRAICSLTAACTDFDIHLNEEGYAVLGDVFRAAVEPEVRAAVRGSASAG